MSTGVAVPDRSSERAHAPWLVWALAVAMAAGALTVLAPLWGDPAAFPDVPNCPWWVLAGAFALAEVQACPIRFRGETYTFTLTEVVLVFGLFAVSPVELIGAQLAAGLVVLGIGDRQPPFKLFFNLAQFALASSCAIAVFRALPTEGGPVSVQSWFATLAATAVSSVIGSVAIALAVSVIQSRQRTAVNFGQLAIATLGDSINTMLGLVVVIVYTESVAATALLIGPMALVFGAYRAYLSEQAKSERLQFVYAASEVLHQSPDLEHQLLALLDFARDTFHAEVAEIALQGEPGQALGYRAAVGPRRASAPLQPVSSELVADLVDLIGTTNRVVVERPDGDSALAARAGIELSSIMAARLRDSSGTRGAVVVMRERRPTTIEFDKDEILLFETFANHLDTTLERMRLNSSVEQLDALSQALSHQAHHDPLTGLANRTLFRERVDAALAQTDSAAPAVLLIDLDDFKGINDTLGHAAGDTVLEAIGHRIKRCIGVDDTAARLGGDEFAVLLLHADPATGAHQVAADILTAVAEPIDVGGVRISASLSVGVAFPRPGMTASELMQQADGAMYTAKRKGKGRVYAASR